MALVYSCCFWFSLRLGGILIGLFSIATVVLIFSCLAYTHLQILTDQYTEWNSQYNLIYSKHMMDLFMEDPHKYISWAIVCKCIYLIACMIYIYGAYVCSNILMVPFIVLELIRLILVIALVATGLLLREYYGHWLTYRRQYRSRVLPLSFRILIDLQMLSVGMFYLWICAANLPILINEMERDEQAATIAKLQELLYTNPGPRRGLNNVRYRLPSEDVRFGRDVFMVSNRNIAMDPPISMNRSKLHAPY